MIDDPYLITPTLLNSWLYLCGSDDLKYEENKTSFISTLNRVKTQPNGNMLKGIEYENKIKSVMDGHEVSEDPVILEIASLLKGSLWQVPVYREVKIRDLYFLVYGRTDAIKMDTIYDIKRVKQYETGKYLSNTQHDIYLWCSGLSNFKYLVSTGDDLYIEEYHLTDYTEERLRSNILDFVNWLKINDLYKAYLKLWKVRI